MMGPFNKKRRKEKYQKEGPFGTIFITEKPVVNDSVVVKTQRRG